MESTLIIGSGWAGAACSYYLEKRGIKTTVLEQKNVVGGHSRSETLNGVIYEPNGPHIFHTSNYEVNKFVKKFGMKRKFEHQVLSRIYPDSLSGESILVSWPPQVSEMKKLNEWKQIQDELNKLPIKPNSKNFETYAISIMGPTLYFMFIYGYTKKQWGLEPKQLSSTFAPKRIDLRTDGNKALFKDKWEYFHPEGSGKIIEKILNDKEVIFEKKADINNIHELATGYSNIVITSALDDFLDSNQKLEWRGIKSKINFFENLKDDQCITESYQINHPTMNEEYTRTIETKHASGQLINSSVVQEEYAYQGIRHYPVYRSEINSENENELLKTIIKKELNLPVYFCGRLANYRYINQDEAILDGFNTARNILESSN